MSNNTVISAGNSAFGALGFDPLQNRSSGAPDFTGSAISNNTLWSSPTTHFIIGLAVGSRPWYGDGSIGYGASVTGNTTTGIQSRFGAGIVVSGMTAATVQQNVFETAAIPTSWTACPIGNVLASVSAGLASGAIQSYSDVLVSGCMSDYAPAQQPAAVTSTPASPVSPSSAAKQVPVAAASATTFQPDSASGASAGSGGGGTMAELDLIALCLLVVWRISRSAPCVASRSAPVDVMYYSQATRGR